jgi:hypothetical protein
MTETLHTHLVSVLNAADINPALSEDEIDSYPYVTFELPVEYRYTKDGPYKIVGNLTIRSVSDDFDQADVLRAGIESAIAQGFGGPSSADHIEDAEEEEVSEVMPADPDEETDPTEETEDPGVDPGENEEPAEAEEDIHHEYDDLVFSARITDVRKDCMDGVWVIEQDYILNQYD